MKNNESSQLFVTNFKSELIKAEAGEASSLSWISIPLSLIQPPDQFEYAITIGGTNIILYKNNLLISKFSINSLKSGMELIHRIVNKIPLTTKSLYINLAYPAKQTISNLGISAHIYKSVKGHHFEDILNHDLQEIFCSLLPCLEKIQIVNDVILLLSNQYIHNQSNAGLIIGTGFNVGIVKDGNAVNLEAGNFNKFSPLDSTLLIDKVSIDPGEQLLEKEIAGKYLYKHYNIIKSVDELFDSENLEHIHDSFSHAVYQNVINRVGSIKTGIEGFLFPTPVKWEYEGSVAEHLLDKMSN